MAHNSENKGSFVISLDFELIWGIWDVTNEEKYGNHIRGVKQVIPALIELFKAYDIKATFATVGFLFARNKEELIAANPALIPSYSYDIYNVYKKEMLRIGQNEQDDPYHFGYSMLEMIKNSPHEIATHTYSHYYCLEKGQTHHEFDADLKAAMAVAEKNNIEMKSLVFPRNQLNPEYLDILSANGLKVYRGNPVSWIYKPRHFAAEVPFIRLCRLLDTYLPISGYNTHIINKKETPVNVPASRFLKPFDSRFKWLEKLRMARIKTEMTKAAQKNQLYHLWWHPHNFGINLDANISFLTELLDHYKFLNQQYGFKNLTMIEAAQV
jgi:peptidoglycan/xylan/chitin deacetylase (PgdA/CDA1 family)